MTYFTRILADVKKYSDEIQNFNVAENKLKYVIKNEVNDVILNPEYVDDVAEKENSLPNTTPMSIGDQHAGFLMNDNTVKLVGNNDQGQTLGANHSGFLLDDSTVHLIGDNEYGQCIMGVNKNANVRQLCLGWDHTGIVYNDGTIALFG